MSRTLSFSHSHTHIYRTVAPAGLSAKEIVAFVVYCTEAEDVATLPKLHYCTLAHICSQPESTGISIGVAALQHQISHIPHELSTRLNRAFVDGNFIEKGILLPQQPRNSNNRRRMSAIPQEPLFSAAKCPSTFTIVPLG